MPSSRILSYATKRDMRCPAYISLRGLAFLTALFHTCVISSPLAYPRKPLKWPVKRTVWPILEKFKKSREKKNKRNIVTPSKTSLLLHMSKTSDQTKPEQPDNHILKVIKSPKRLRYCFTAGVLDWNFASSVTTLWSFFYNLRRPTSQSW